ncbi:MAG TPA: GNAT family N-acetyltransferase [Candidatus Nanopelagicales bacterium]|nr:GNAT family N-acetyltransferase [Candidatus Nanopelagicales bacterium]
MSRTSGSVPPVSIRLARPEEYAEVGELVGSAYVEGGALNGDSGYVAHLRDVAGRAGEHPVLVAEREGRLVGTVTLTPYGTAHSHDARPGELEFRYLGVAREAWGTGVGEALVDAVDQAAREAGDTALVLSVIETNGSAQRLYRRLGFEPDPTRDREPAPGVRLTFWSRPVR